jgi:hypothetical protein
MKYIALGPAGVVQHVIIAGCCAPLIFLLIMPSHLNYSLFDIIE